MSDNVKLVLIVAFFLGMLIYTTVSMFLNPV